MSSSIGVFPHLLRAFACHSMGDIVRDMKKLVHRHNSIILNANS